MEAEEDKDKEGRGGALCSTAADAAEALAPASAMTRSRASAIAFPETGFAMIEGRSRSRRSRSGMLCGCCAGAVAPVAARASRSADDALPPPPPSWPSPNDCAMLAASSRGVCFVLACARRVALKASNSSGDRARFTASIKRCFSAASGGALETAPPPFSPARTSIAASVVAELAREAALELEDDKPKPPGAAAED